MYSVPSVRGTKRHEYERHGNHGHPVRDLAGVRCTVVEFNDEYMLARRVAPVKQAIDAIYENGKFRPVQPETIAIPEGQQVRITVDDDREPETLRLAISVYEGLSDSDIREVEEVALDRGSFFGPKVGN